MARNPTEQGVVVIMMPRGLSQAHNCRERCALGIIASVVLIGAGCASSPPKLNVSPATSVTSSSTVGPTTEQDQTTDSVNPTSSTSTSASTTSTGTTVKKKPFKSPVLAKSFDEAVSRGDAAWLSGDADMAVYLYVQALSYRPRDVMTLTKLGVIEQHSGNLQLAARAYELAANSSPNDMRVSAQLGLVYLALGQDDSARTWLLRSVDTASADWRVYDGLGVVEQRHGDDAAALQHLQRAQALAPDIAAPLLHSGQAMFDRGDYAAAETAVRAALKREATPETWQLLGTIQAHRRAYADSLDSLLEVMDAPAAYNMVAKTALDNGDNAVALHYFEKASSLSPVYLPDAERNANKARERLDSVGH
jgi:Flp pilus assembly protein TadD